VARIDAAQAPTTALRLTRRLTSKACPFSLALLALGGDDLGTVVHALGADPVDGDAALVQLPAQRMAADTAGFQLG